MAFDVDTALIKFPSLGPDVAPNDPSYAQHLADSKAKAQGFIDGALGLIEAYCDRYFMRKAVGAVFHYPDDNAYSLKRYPINRIIRIYTRDSLNHANTWDLNNHEYQVHRNAGLVLTGGYGGSWYGAHCGNEIVIEYDGGYDVLPAALETALWMTFGRLVEQSEQYSSSPTDLAFDKLDRVSIPDVGTLSFATDRNITSGSSGKGWGMIPGAAVDLLNLFKRYEA